MQIDLIFLCFDTLISSVRALPLHYLGFLYFFKNITTDVNARIIKRIQINEATVDIEDEQIQYLFPKLNYAQELIRTKFYIQNAHTCCYKQLEIDLEHYSNYCTQRKAIFHAAFQAFTLTMHGLKLNHLPWATT